MGYGLKNPDALISTPDWGEVPAELLLKHTLFEANEGSGTGVATWLSRVCRYGLTKALADELSEAMAPLQAAARPTIDPTSGLHWRIDRAALESEYNVLSGSTLIKEQKESGEVSSLSSAIQSVTEHLDELSVEDQERIYELHDACSAYRVAFLIDRGIHEHLRKCERPKCRKFYIGGPRSKWCSDNCGGIVRTQRKRKLDKM
jgi:hypothetical protein